MDVTKFVASNQNIFKMDTADVLNGLESVLTEYGYHPVNFGSFVYAKGNVPVMLIAHCDTVFDKRKESDKDKLVFWDKETNVMWSPSGLGSDDRSGVLGILALLEDGYRPFVLFTDEEETGGRGAKDFCEYLDFTKASLEVSYIIELDRQGSKEAVFYDDGNEEFQKMVLSHGFNIDMGTFTDISIICPHTHISGVNLSCGFNNAHQQTEYFSIDSLQYTVDIVSKMLEEVAALTESHVYKYIDNSYDYFTSYYDRDNLLLMSTPGIDFARNVRRVTAWSKKAAPVAKAKVSAKGRS
jgi:acetylornithine deacetylase/succinyl-diaminopimelate desuccinylase-like protein